MLELAHFWSFMDPSARHAVEKFVEVQISSSRVIFCGQRSPNEHLHGWVG